MTLLGKSLKTDKVNFFKVQLEVITYMYQRLLKRYQPISLHQTKTFMKQLNSPTYLLTLPCVCEGRGCCCYKRRLNSDYGLPLVAKVACKEMIDRTSCRETQTKKKVPPIYLRGSKAGKSTRDFQFGWLACSPETKKLPLHIIQCIVRWGQFPLLFPRFAKIR